MPSSDPLQLDVLALADDQETRSGTTPLARFQRLSAGLASVPADADAHWSVAGLWRQAGTWGRQPTLHLRVTATLPMACQRCLDAVAVPVAVDRCFVFAPDEEAAVRWDAELNEDVLTLQHPFDLAELIEDELIMAVPPIPRHAQCEHLPPQAAQTDDFDASAPENPFSVLAGYGRKSRG